MDQETADYIAKNCGVRTLYKLARIESYFEKGQKQRARTFRNKEQAERFVKNNIDPVLK